MQGPCIKGTTFVSLLNDDFLLRECETITHISKLSNHNIVELKISNVDSLTVLVDC